MANNELEFPLGFVDKRLAVAAGVVAETVNPANYDDVASLRSRLAAVNAGYYTSARLDSMLKNDMLYALRLADDPTSL